MAGMHTSQSLLGGSPSAMVSIPARHPFMRHACRCSARVGMQLRASMHQNEGGHAQQPAAQRSRRQSLAGLTALAAAVTAAWPLAAGDASAAEGLLPKGYQDLSTRLVKALREAIETDLGDNSESEVRRKADSAKGLVREWMINWRDNAMVSSSNSHRELSGTIRELGQYYMKNGQRARLSSAAGSSLLRRLDGAAVSLPP